MRLSLARDGAAAPLVVTFAMGFLQASHASPAVASGSRLVRTPAPVFAPVRNLVNGAASRESVTFQYDTSHTGDAHGNLRLPLTQRWSVNLVGPIGYPVVAQHTVVVAANGELIALDAKTGNVKWSQPAPTGGSWVGPAYDNGMIFSNVRFTNGSQGVGMYAFDIKSGKQVWSAVLPGQYAFSSPPTALGGMVYTGGAGSGGTVYAFNESNGTLVWHSSVENGDDSSPVVTSSGLYVSYACPQAYDFNPATGSQIWHYSGPCEGGGGSTPVLYDNLLWVEDSFAVSGFDGIALDAASGNPASDNFNSIYTPAFSRHIGYFVSNSTTLVAANVPSLSSAWSATVSGSEFYATPPLVVGSTVYVATNSGQLLGYDAKSGALSVQMNLGASSQPFGFWTGLGFGSKELIVPNGSQLIALQGS